MRQKSYSKLSEKKISEKLLNRFIVFLTTPDEKEKYVDIIEKTPEGKAMIQSSSSSNCVCYYNIEILNQLDPELQLINSKPVMKKSQRTCQVS